MSARPAVPARVSSLTLPAARSQLQKKFQLQLFANLGNFTESDCPLQLVVFSAAACLVDLSQ